MSFNRKLLVRSHCLMLYVRSPLAAIAVAMLATVPVHADLIVDNLLTVDIDGYGTYSYSSDDLGGFAQNADGTFSINGAGQRLMDGPPGYQFELSDWNIQVNEDPFIHQAFGFANVAAVPLIFTITTDLPVAPVGPSTLMGGSTGGSVTDANNNGLGGLSTVAPTAFYTGRIDGVNIVPAAELHPDPFGVGFLFAGDTNSIPDADFGLPGPTVPGPAVAASIGIQNKFSLSGGDSVASTNFFIVEPIPEPSTIVLLYLGSLGIMAAARRPRTDRV